MKLPTLIIVCVLACACLGEDLAPAVAVLRQDSMGTNACGPYSFVNSLLQSGDQLELEALPGKTPLEKAENFGGKFGARESVVYGKHRHAYSDTDGTADKDLLAMINDFRAQNHLPSLSGEFLVRKKKETSEDFVKRIHGKIKQSIATGFDPILSIKSVKAETNDTGEFNWDAIIGHWVAVVDVAWADDNTLLLKLADSVSGKISGALLYPDLRGSVVPMTFKVDKSGNEVWDWVDGDRCLFLASSTLALGTPEAKWHERTYIAARFLITAHPGESHGSRKEKHQ